MNTKNGLVKAIVPFNSTNKYAFYICECPTNNSHYCMYIKGAPEKIWNMSTHILLNGEVRSIQESEERGYANVNKKFAKNGERVLGFAKHHSSQAAGPKSLPV